MIFARADGSFGPTGTYPITVSSTAIAAGDLDGDGLADLVVASASDDALSILRQQPGGSFTEVVVLPLSEAPCDVATVDMDMDGLLDIVAGCSDAGVVKILRNQGDLGFSEPDSYPNGSKRFAVADLNSDHAPDIAGIGYQTLNIAFNDGHGGLVIGPRIALQSDPDSVIAADLNDDELPDLVAGTSQGPMWAMNLGSGEFAGAQHSYANAGGDAVAALDLDHDSDLDVVTCDTFRGVGAVAINDGDGNLASPAMVGLRETPVALAAARFLGRGSSELAVLCRDTGEVMFLEPDGRGGFRQYERGVAGSGAEQLAPGDFDLDGDADVVVASSGHLDIYSNDGDGGFTYSSSLPISRTPYAVAVVDLDGDADEDVVCNAYLQKYISLYFNQGGFDLSTRLDLPVASAPYELFGWRDSAAGHCTLFGLHSGSVSIWLLSQGGGVLGPVRIGAGSSTRDAAVGDFDGNGWPDLAVARNATSIAVFLGRGGLKFQGVPVGNFGTLTRSVGAADFDADGYDDIAVLTLDGGLWMLRGSPSGFGAELLGTDLESSSDVLVGDADGDGRIDIVLIRSGSLGAAESSCSLWRNVDGRVFVHHGRYAIGREVDSGALSDIDGDGDGDLLTPNGDGGLFTILRARGARRR